MKTKRLGLLCSDSGKAEKKNGKGGTDIRMCLGGGREAMPVRATAQGDYSEESPQI